MSEQQQRPRRGRAFGVFASALVVLVLTLSGCVSIQAARDPVTSVAKPGEGTVVVSVTINTSEVTQFDMIQLLRVEPEPAKGQPKAVPHYYQLNNTLAGLSRDTALFTGYLPAGEYRFESLHDTQTLKYLQLGPSQAQLVGNFTVQPGTTVDLGRLVLASAGMRAGLGRSALITSNRDLIERFAPDYLKLYAGQTATGWVGGRNPIDLVEEYAFARPQGATGFSELSTGEVVGGTRMGTLLLRGKDGSWNAFARTGQLDAILWTVPYEQDGLIAVAGGELGTLVGVERSGKVRPIDLGDLPKGNLFFVDRAPDGGSWIAGVLTQKEAVLFRSPRLDHGTWTRLRGDSVEFSAWNGARMVWAWPRNGGIGFASTESRKVACYDYASGQWSEHDAPGKRRITALTASPNGPIGVLTSPGGGFGGIFAGTHYSLDCGASWVETKSPYKVKVVPPLVLPSNTVLESGGVFGDSGIYANQIGSAKWEKRTDRVSFDEAIWLLPRAGLLSVSRGQWGFETIMHSADEGRTWKAEASSIDRDALGAPAGAGK